MEAEAESSEKEKRSGRRFRYLLDEHVVEDCIHGVTGRARLPSQDDRKVCWKGGEAVSGNEIAIEKEKHVNLAEDTRGDQLDLHRVKAEVGIERVEFGNIIAASRRRKRSDPTVVSRVPRPASFTHVLREVQVVTVISENPEARTIGSAAAGERDAIDTYRCLERTAEAIVRFDAVPVPVLVISRPAERHLQRGSVWRVVARGRIFRGHGWSRSTWEGRTRSRR